MISMTHYPVPYGEAFETDLVVQPDVRGHQVDFVIEASYRADERYIIDTHDGQDQSSLYHVEHLNLEHPVGSYYLRGYINLGESDEEQVWPSRYDRGIKIMIGKERHLR